MAVKFFNVVKEKIENIKVDPTNPNVVPEIKMEALKEMINKFGFLEPIVVNKDNVIVDGEHRFTILKEQGAKEIPVIKIDVNAVDQKIIRQTMNKLRGSHNPREDIEDLLRISKEVNIQDMSRYLGLEEKNLQDYLSSIDQEPESFLSLRMEEKNKASKWRFITLKLTPEQAQKILEQLKPDESIKDVALIPMDGLVVSHEGKEAK